MICCAAFSSVCSCVSVAVRGAWKARMRCSRFSTWVRPPRAGSTASTSLPYSSAPTRLPWRVSSRASTATNSADTARLVRSSEPKSTLPDRSSRNQALSSRSSVYSRT